MNQKTNNLPLEISLKQKKTARSPWRIAWGKLRRDPAALFGLAGLIIVLLAVLCAPWIAPYDPNVIDSKVIFQAPNTAHLFGTDDYGRDNLSRVIWGGRESLRAAILAIMIAMLGGTTFGLLSGFYRGWVDRFIMRMVDVLLAFPTILLLLSIIAVLGPSLITVLIALGLSAIPAYTRIVRGSVLGVREMEYVTAARALGVKNGRIMFAHILPNIVAPIIVYSTMGFGGAIMMTAGLSYIGMGAQPPSAEWGSMLNMSRQYMRDAWWMSVFPGLAIFFCVLCINLLGDGLRSALDPKMR
jgi:peptide/nickel transport system permease protein